MDEQAHLPFFIFLCIFFAFTPIEIHKEWYYMNQLPDSLSILLVRLLTILCLYGLLRFGFVSLLIDEEEEDDEWN